MISNPHLFNGFKLTRILGANSYSTVYEAVKTADGSATVLRAFETGQIYRKKTTEKQRLFKVLEGMKHDHLLPMRRARVTSEYVVLEMERADGNLYQMQDCCLQETGKRIPVEDLLDLLDQAATALDDLRTRPGLQDQLQGRYVQHGGIHPGNLFVVGDKLKIGDFGISSYPFRSPRDAEFSSRLFYMAPELYEKRFSPRSDQYALAIVFCEHCPGERCFVTKEPRHPWSCPINLKKLRLQEYPILIRALQRDWTQRWPSCREFISALRAAVQAPRRPVSKRNFHNATSPAAVSNRQF